MTIEIRLTDPHLMPREALKKLVDYLYEERIAPSVPDIDGQAWDESIHTRTRSRNPDGSWKLKRNAPSLPIKLDVPKTLCDDTSLKDTQGLMWDYQMHASPPSLDDAGAWVCRVEAQSECVRMQDPDGIEPAPDDVVNALTLQQLVAHVMRWLREKRFKLAHIGTVVKEFDLINLNDLFDKPHLIPAVYRAFEKYINTKEGI